MAIPKDPSAFIEARKAAIAKYNKQNKKGAEEWIKKGAYVLPIVPGVHKKPFVQWALATNTDEGVNRFWDTYTDALIGVHTENSHWIVLDFDKKNGGMESYKRLISEHPEITNTYSEQTRSGGIHLIYKDMGYKIKTGANAFKSIGYPGIDIRAAGGIVVVAPSIDDLGIYTAINNVMPADLPKYVYDLLDSACYIDKPELYETRPALTLNVPIGESLFPPCMTEMMRVARAGINHDREREHGLSHNERVALASFLKNIGMEADQIVAVFSAVPDFDEATTKYQVNWLFKMDYKCPKCSTMKTWGICLNDGSCEVGSPLYDYKSKVEKSIEDQWKTFTLVDACQDRPPIQYAVKGIIPLPSLIVPYGAPGSLKSFVIADMAICIAAGINWLAPVTVDMEGGNVTDAADAITVNQCPVIWVDFDNGERKTHDRFKILCNGHGIKNPEDIPFYYYSMPNPTLDASNDVHVRGLTDRIKRHKARVVIIDNLAMVSGDNDENSAEMKKVMFNFRRLSEETESAIIIIHHERKDTKNNGARVGESLRGHSSIEGAIDLALLVKRDNVDSKDIMLKSTKTRGEDVKPFGARFTFEKDRMTGETTRAFFYRTGVKEATDRKVVNDSALVNAIIKVLKQAETQHRSPNTEDIIAGVKIILADNEKVSKGEKAVKAALDKMLSDKWVECIQGGKNSKFWNLVEDENNDVITNNEDL